MQTIAFVVCYQHGEGNDGLIYQYGSRNTLLDISLRLLSSFLFVLKNNQTINLNYNL
jgi:hypothetical protein